MEVAEEVGAHFQSDLKGETVLCDKFHEAGGGEELCIGRIGIVKDCLLCVLGEREERDQSLRDKV